MQQQFGKRTSFVGNGEAFSKFMYDFRECANTGFTFIDIDGILRNYRKQTLAIVEIKCRQAALSFAQKQTFNELDVFLKRGICCGWDYIGFFVLQFEGESFEDGQAFLNGCPITADSFKDWLKINF